MNIRTILILTLTSLLTPTAIAVTIDGEEYYFKNSNFQTTSSNNKQYEKFPYGITHSQVFENGLNNYTNRVIINKTTGEEALLTGKLRVIHVKDITAQEIAEKYNIIISSEFQRRNAAYFSPNNQDLFELKKSMDNDNSLIEVKIELVTTIYATM